MKKTMMACNLHQVGDLRYEEVPIPRLKDDEVLVKICYCGICGSDVSRVFAKGTYKFPTIPGHEFSGIVEYDPEGELTGRRVSVFPLIPCGDCEMCKDECYELCSSYDYYGSRRDGGFAEYQAVKRWNLVFLPDHVSMMEGAMCEPVSVAYHAIARLEVQPGDHVLISGAGFIGLVVAHWARILGAEKVSFFDLSVQNIAFAKQMGFFEYQDGERIDAVVEGTGAADALMRCLSAVKPHGHVVLMGNPDRDITITQQSYWHMMRKELHVTGTWNSSFSARKNDWKTGLEYVSAGRLNLEPFVTHVFPMSNIAEAFSVIRNRDCFTLRVLLRMNEEADM